MYKNHKDCYILVLSNRITDYTKSSATATSQISAISWLYEFLYENRCWNFFLIVTGPWLMRMFYAYLVKPVHEVLTHVSKHILKLLALGSLDFLLQTKQFYQVSETWRHMIVLEGVLRGRSLGRIHTVLSAKYNPFCKDGFLPFFFFWERKTCICSTCLCIHW